MRTGDVAIIGAAGIFPDADDLETFHANLRQGRSSVGRPGDGRVLNCGGERGVRYLAMGYLDRPDLFDHDLFGIPRREAELMDPHQRILLQLTHQAIESAGYAPGRLAGSGTAVLVAASDAGAGPADGERDVVEMLGTSVATLAARISYLFDFRGPALVVDTACSSGLTALDLAVSRLRADSAPLAVVGGMNLFPALLPREGWEPLPGLESPDETCRPFDASANGMTAGEGGGVLVLKPLTAAVADADNVLAVLKGIAVNHNGHRAAGMAAPSQVAQASVITQAWRDGGVEPATVGYVECHGSGTPLGDVVEVDALRRAFSDAGVTGRHCAIGSVKANIGHLGNAAGIAGLFKAMLALRHGVRYPAVNFASPNPLIDFGGAVYVGEEDDAWPEPANGTARRAGVSSWGMTGTNVHAVLEQAPPPAPERGHPATRGAELVTVSARTPAALRRYVARLVDFAEDTGPSVRSLAHVLNRGRDDHRFRLAVTAATPGELAAALRSAPVPTESADTAPRVVLLCSGDALPDDSLWSRLLASSLGLPPAEWAELAELDAGAPNPAARLVVRQYALHRLAESLGLSGTEVIASGPGHLVTRVVRGELPLTDAVTLAAARELSDELDRPRLAALAAGLVRDGATLVELAGEGVLSRELGATAPELPTADLAGDGSRRDVLDRLGRLYTLGATIDWDRHYRDSAIRRIEVPTYPFEPTPVWRARPATTAPARPERPPQDGPAGLQEAERRVAEIWSDLLDVPGLGPETDYFAAGGTSLIGVGLLRRLMRDFGVEVTFADLYAHPTARAMAARLQELAAERAAVAPEAPITPIERGDRLPLSPGQEQLWYLDQVNPASPLYNIPGHLRLAGPLDEAALRGALLDAATRHEVLRSAFGMDDNGAPYVSITAPEPVMPVFDLSRMPERDRDQRVRVLLHEATTRPFDLARDTLFRPVLVRLAGDDHVLLLTFHHIVWDGGSPPAFYRDLREFYRARTSGGEPRLPELPVQYQDYAAWHRARLAGPRLDRATAFWRDELSGLRRGELPLDHPRPAVQSHAGGVVRLAIGREVAERVRAYSRRTGVTTFVTMLAALQALVHRWAGLNDVVIGVATSGRIHPDTQELAGYFNSLPPFRTQVASTLPFAELVQRCARTVAGVLDHEDIPLNRILAAGGIERDLSRHPLYDVTYTYQNVPPYRGGMGDLEMSPFSDGEVGGAAPGTAKFDLSVGLVDTGEGAMAGEIEYATALFDRATAERLAAWFPALLAEAMADPDGLVGDLAEPATATVSDADSVTDSVTASDAGRAATAPLPRPPERTGGPVPAEGTLEVLRGLFEQVLNVDRVEDDDGFFALGGDSVLSIQLVARARKAGVVITQRQVFESKTPGELARSAGDRVPLTVVSADDRNGPVPLTPVMLEAAERSGVPARFTQSMLLVVPAGLDTGGLEVAVRALAERHETLRARLVRADEDDPRSWTLEDSPPQAGCVRRVDAAELSTEELADLVRTEGEAAAGRLDPRTGVMAQLVWFDPGPRREGRVLLVVHHLAVDLVSWQALVSDLEAAYAAAGEGTAPAPAPEETSFGEWARRMAEIAVEPSVTATLPEWQRILAPGEPVPGGRPLDPRTDTMGDTRHVSVPLPAPVTDAVLTTAPDAFRTGTSDLLLAGLCAATAEWRAVCGDASGPVLVDLESHGREPLTPDMDVSLTVGWFTCVHPVRFDPGPLDFAEVRDGGPAAGRLVRHVKDRLGAVPGNGLGYGLLRFLNPATGPALADLPTPSIGFNYLGAPTRGAGPAGDSTGWRPIATGGDVDAKVPCAHALEAMAAIVDTPRGPELNLSLSSPRRLLDEEPLRDLCEGWAAMVTGLAAHAGRPGASGHVPSDFPMVSLSQDQIDQIEAGMTE
ncbi:condensation domain-containing protein [Spirillospora sp. NPDC052269]